MLDGFISRLRDLFRRSQTEGELDEEMQYHLHREIERNVARGLSPAHAEQAARRAFGNVTVAAEQSREAMRWRGLEELRQDVAYAFRSFRRVPTFVLTVVATIGLGLGLAATAFTLFDAYMLRPIDVRDGRSLYAISWRSRDGWSHHLEWSQYTELARDRHVFGSSFAFLNLITRVRGGPTIGQLVSGDYFDVLGVRPALGRLLVPADAAVPRTGAVIVLSHATWESVFGADSSIVGSSIVMNGIRLTVVGVSREGFTGIESLPIQFWVPITMAPLIKPDDDPFDVAAPQGVNVVGRMRDGYSEGGAATEMATLLAPTTREKPPAQRLSGILLTSKGTAIELNRQVLAAVIPLALAFLFVLLIACANIANVMLARGMARQREIGIRLSLGAGRPRLVRQLLTESVLLAVPSAVAGYLLSRVAIIAGLKAMYVTAPPEYRGYLRPLPLTPDARIVGFIMFAAVLSAVVFGLVPALKATRPSVVQATRGDFEHLRPSRLRGALVAAQVTLSVLLLIVTGILLHASRTVGHLSPGIRTANLVQIDMLDRGRDRALAQLATMPVVERVATSQSPPLDGLFRDVHVGVSANHPVPSKFNIVSANYFAMLDLRPSSGRTFTRDEADARAPVVVVSEATARRFWPSREAIGQALYLDAAAADVPLFEPYRRATVIGIVRDVPPGWIGVSSDIPTVYYPQPLNAPGSSILASVSAETQQGRMAIDKRLSSDDSIALQGIHSLDAALAVQRYPFDAAYWVASLVGSVALLLTVTGVFGVLSYLVTQRTREFGVRLALGASPSAIVGLVIRQLGRLALVGVVIGVALAAAASAVVGSVLNVIDTRDPVGYVVGVAVVLASCLVAAYTPSRRAASVNAVDALRAD